MLHRFSSRLLCGIAIIITPLLLLSGCGGGGGGTTVAFTVRPKTLDGIKLRLSSQVEFEFIAGLSSYGAIKDGDVETGTFIYKPLYDFTYGDEGKANDHSNFPNLEGGTTLTAFPISVGIATYTYTAINSNQGVIHITAFGADSFHAGHQIPFIQDSNFNATNVIELDVSFSSVGGAAVVNTVTFRQPSSSNLKDTMFIPSLIGLASGGAVPENYFPEVDPLRPSKICPTTLDGRFLYATNGSFDFTKNFSIDLIKDNGYVPSGSGVVPDEIGTGLIRVDGTVVAGAANYTWRRINGTDSGELVLSNIPDTSPAFGTSLNGKMTLTFLGTQSGNYAGVVDADTLDAADVTGTFTLLNEPAP